MNNFDNELREELINYLKVPEDLDEKVYEALELAQNMKRENRKNNKKGTCSIGLTRLKYTLLAIIASILTGLTGFTVYAGAGGTINGIPAFEWVNISFGGKISDYKNQIEGQKVQYGETSVNLVSTTNLEYATILEFDVKLSDEDKEFLRLGESVLTQKDIDDSEKFYARTAILQYANSEDSNNKFDSFEKNEYGEIDIDKVPNELKEEATNWYEKTIVKAEKERAEQEGADMELLLFGKEKFDARINRYRKYINTIGIGFYKEKTIDKDYWLGEEVIDDGDPRHDFNSWALPNTNDYYDIDGEKVPAKSYQSIEKISDNEYKIYLMILMTDEDLENKTTYNLKLDNISLSNKAELKKGEILNKYENIGYLVNTANNTRVLHIDGKISVDIDKTKILSDSRIVEDIEQISQFENVTEKIDEIIITPVHTIIKTRTTLTNITNTRQNNLENEFPLWMEYNITDENGNVIDNTSNKTQQIVTMKDGTVEEIDVHDVKERMENATVEYVTYIILDTINTNQISIEPHFKTSNNRRTSDESYKEYDQKLPKIVIDL